MSYRAVLQKANAEHELLAFEWLMNWNTPNRLVATLSCKPENNLLGEKLRFNFFIDDHLLYQALLICTEIKENTSRNRHSDSIKLYAQSFLLEREYSLPKTLLGGVLLPDGSENQVNEQGCFQIDYPAWVRPKKQSTYVHNVQSVVSDNGGHSHSPLKASELWQSGNLMLGALSNSQNPSLLNNEESNISLWQQFEQTQVRWQQPREQTLAQLEARQGKAFFQMGETSKLPGFLQFSPGNIKQQNQGGYSQNVGGVSTECLFKDPNWHWTHLLNVERYSDDIVNAVSRVCQKGQIEEKFYTKLFQEFKGDCEYTHQGNLMASYGALHQNHYGAETICQIESIPVKALSVRFFKECYQGKIFERERLCKTEQLNKLVLKAHKQSLYFDDYALEVDQKTLIAKQSTWQCQQYFASMQQYQTQGDIQVRSDRIDF